MVKMQAYLEGSILYIGSHEFGIDFSPDEAAEEIENLQDMPGAPSGVRIFSRPRSRRKKGHTGWPIDLAPKFQYGSETGSGWPKP